QMEDKVCIITGANEGIGRETAKRMAAHNMRVILACRNIEKAEVAKQMIIDETNNDKIQCMKLDLNSLDSVREFVQNFKNMNLPLNYLINNAGKYGGPYELTEDGFESQFGVNHLGPFLLTNLLLSTLEASDNPRIVILTSRLHFHAKLDLDRLSVDPKDYGAKSAYSQSKLCNMLFTNELQRRLDAKGSKIVVNAMHPGLVLTNILHSYPFLNKYVIPLFSFMFTKVTVSAEVSEALALGTAPHLQGVKGKFFNIKEEQPSSPFSRDPENARQVWETSCEMVKIPVDIQL
ncbi:hypothetical protein SAMD00019534_102580, partial [Acytostelium subglobosum LB1]|uniref:hypothetical protein n=1 Tax=Acytostelium subglobosum LB1 TaxID=1410327 RepID=UPI000644FE0A